MKLFKILFLTIVSNFYFAQNNFELNIKAMNYVNDSLWFGIPQAKIGLENLYQFKLEKNKNVENLSEKMNIPYSFYNLLIKDENILKGQIDYPQPVAFMYMDKKQRTNFATNIFFIEKGNYNIVLPKISNGIEINIKSPSNLEYINLKNILRPLYIKSQNQNKQDSLSDFNKKQEIIATYIQKKPNSYVALWEIINDYTFYNYNAKYLENLSFFSSEVKNSLLFKNFENKLINEKNTQKGNKIPNIYFDKKNSLTEKDFNNYKLTFIDYWSTSCAPCIKGMPEIVKLRNEFKDKNVNFLTITDENKSDRIKKAKEILAKNNATWTNYFDINKDFSKKVNATSYPLHFIIDSDGKIIARIIGDLEEARKTLHENLK
jgi:thiol-disulfide isomerase/thioredoxin